jgi:hypothetical protein
VWAAILSGTPVFWSSQPVSHQVTTRVDDEVLASQNDVPEGGDSVSVQLDTNTAPERQATRIDTDLKAGSCTP